MTVPWTLIRGGKLATWLLLLDNEMVPRPSPSG